MNTHNPKTTAHINSVHHGGVQSADGLRRWSEGCRVACVDIRASGGKRLSDGQIVEMYVPPVLIERDFQWQ